MSDNLQKIMELEDKLGSKMVEDGIKTTDVVMEKIVLRISKLLKKLSNDELLTILDDTVYIHRVIDVLDYFKPYKINKKELKENNCYYEAYQDLDCFIARVIEVSLNQQEFMYISHLCDVDSVADYLLSKMSNEEISKIAEKIDDWNVKLFLFAHLKDK